jgi:cold shock CspA family protein
MMKLEPAQANAYAAFIYGQPKTQIGHHQNMEPTTFRATNAPVTEVPVANAQQGKIVKLNKTQEFGYVDFNGAELFFHHAQFIEAMPFAELAIGTVMRFNVVFNKTSGKNIAKNVAFVEHARPVAIGHHQSMQVAKLTSTAVEPSVKVNKLNVSGTVVEVKQNFGFIDCDHELVFFHESQVNGPVSEISAGQVVNFNLMYNTVSERLVAHSVNVVSDVPKFVDCIQDAKTTRTTVKVNKLNVRGTVVEVKQNFGFVDCDHELVFFHESEINGPISEISAGQVVNFNLMYNTVSNRLVAHGVTIINDVPKFVGAKFDQATVNAASVSNGKITSVGNDHGFINENVHFHYSQLIDTVLEEVKVGQSVKFTKNGNTAANVTPVQDDSVGLVMAKDLLKVEAAKMLRRLSVQIVVNDFGNELKPMDVSSRKGSIASDLFLTPPDRTSRRGSIVNRIR